MSRPPHPARLMALLALALLAASSSAQTRPNAVSVEVGGAGGAYSLAYERTVAPDVHVRAGLEYYGLAGAAPVAVLWTPDVGGRSLRPEGGVGVVVGVSDSPALFSGGDAAEDGDLDVHMLPTASLGARLTLRTVDLRAGATALYGVKTAWGSGGREMFVQPQIGLSVRF